MNEGRYVGTNVGNYTLKKLLGQGSFGEVYLAIHQYNKQVVAIKLMVNPTPNPTGYLEEARKLLILKHESILPIIDFDPQGRYIIMEYAPNGTLAERITQYRPQRLPLSEAISIISQIGKALHYAHAQNIVHRDLKPANILFNAKGDAVLADLGIALALEAGETTRVPYVEGTYQYMAPEQFNGEVSVKSDQYALGCIAYELVTGEKAISAVIPSYSSGEMQRDIWRNAHFNHIPEKPRIRLNKDLPVYAEHAILKALEKNRKDRYGSVIDFVTALKGTMALENLDLIRSATLWQNEGHEHVKNKRYDEAIKAYDIALQLNPDEANIYNSKGVVLFELKRYLEALDVYRLALEVALPNKKDMIFLNIGHVLFELKNYDMALESYETAISLSPDKEIFYIYKGNVLKEKKLYNAALKDYDFVIQHTKNNIFAARSFTYKGEIFLSTKCYPEAFEAFEKALQHNARDASIYLAQGRALWKSGLYKKARDIYEQGFKLYPDNTELYDRYTALQQRLRS